MKTDKLAEVVAILAERDEDFQPFTLACVQDENLEESYWSIANLKYLLGYEAHESLDRAINDAKIATSKAGMSIRTHFVDGGLFADEGETYVSKYAAVLITMNADVSKHRVAIAKAFFALQVDKQQLENEKRLKSRLDVATENKKLVGEAKRVGVDDFQRFNGVGVSALYGGLSASQISKKKNLPASASYLDFACSEELAANLFRITQTTAALRRQDRRSEDLACQTHRKVALGVRDAIKRAGNLPPEELPAAKTKIDAVATEFKKKLRSRE